MLRRDFISGSVIQLAAMAAAQSSAAAASLDAAGPADSRKAGTRAVEPGAISGAKFPVRARLALNGEWEYEPLARTLMDEDGTIREERANLPGAGHMPVPSNWHLTGLKDFHGRVAFRRQFTVGQDLAAAPAWLCFAGVDYFAEVSLNGQLLGRHEGYFEPFEIDVTGLLKEGANALEVIADAPREELKAAWPGKNKRQIKGILNQWLPLERYMEPTGGIIGRYILSAAARCKSGLPHSPRDWLLKARPPRPASPRRLRAQRRSAARQWWLTLTSFCAKREQPACKSTLDRFAGRGRSQARPEPTII